MAGLTSTGLEPKTLDEILAELKTYLRDNVSASLNLESTSLLGQFNGANASQLRQLWELAVAVHAARSRSGAEGEALDAIGELTGCIREPATKSTVQQTIVATAGSYAIGTLIFHPVGAPERRFANAVEVTGNGTYLFEAEETGPVRADSGTLTVIAEAVAGLTSGTNAADAELGSDIETDTAYRRRQVDELARPGSTTVDAIRADLLDVADVEHVTVYENDSDVTNGDGQPPHSIEAVVLGGTDAAVRAAVYAAKAGGIQAYGTNSGTVSDSQGNPHTVAFSRPSDITIYVSATLTYLDGIYPGDTAVKQALVDWADASLGVGHDVLRALLFFRLYTAGAGGIVNISALTLGTTVSPVGTSDIVIGVRQRAVFDTSRVVLTSSAVGGPP
jgi:uncharacterized phage protein gp47/JayE